MGRHRTAVDQQINYVRSEKQKEKPHSNMAIKKLSTLFHKNGLVALRDALDNREVKKIPTEDLVKWQSLC